MRSENKTNGVHTDATRLTKTLFDVDCDAVAIIMQLCGS